MCNIFRMMNGLISTRTDVFRTYRRLSYAPSHSYDVRGGSRDSNADVPSVGTPPVTNADDSSIVKCFLEEMEVLSPGNPTLGLVKIVLSLVDALTVYENVFDI